MRPLAACLYFLYEELNDFIDLLFIYGKKSDTVWIYRSEFEVLISNNVRNSKQITLCICMKLCTRIDTLPCLLSESMLIHNAFMLRISYFVYNIVLFKFTRQFYDSVHFYNLLNVILSFMHLHVFIFYKRRSKADIGLLINVIFSCLKRYLLQKLIAYKSLYF